MRDFLTGIAIILIVALSTMLVAPYFVDWNGQRGLLERELSRALGQKVTIGGDIDLKLLPTPYLRLNQAVIGSDDGAVRVGIRHLDLELSVAPLLHGEFDIIEGHLDEPTVRVTLQPGRTLPTLPATPALRADVRLERVVVSDGTLAIADPQSGRTFIVDHVNASTEAPSLAGPFKGQGVFGSGAGRTRFRFSTTTATGGTTHLNLSLAETAVRPGLALDGLAQLRPVAGEIEANFTGSFATQGRVPAAAGGGPPTPWQLSGTLALNPERAVLTAGTLRIGNEDNGLSLNATGNGDFGEQRGFHLDLAAKELDIDRLAGAPLDASTPKPPQLPPLAELRRLAAVVAPPMSTDVSIRIDAATWGNEPLTDLSARFTLGDSLEHDFSLSGQGPGGLRLSADGTAAAGGGFSGRFALGADDVALATRWLKSVAPAMAVSPRDLPFHSASIAGRLAVGRGAQQVDDLALVLDGSKLGGRLRITPATGDGRATVTADLKANNISLDSLPSLRAFRRGAMPVDLDLNLDVGRVDVAQVGSGSLRTGPVHLDLLAEGSRTTVRSLKIANLDGADVDAVGRIENGTATLTGTLDAAKLEAAAELAQQLAPGRTADLLATRAASLAPVHLKIDGAFPLGKPGGTRARLDMTGSLGNTAVAVRLAPDPASAGEVLAAEADARAGGTLLRQIGLPSVRIGTIGASRLTLNARGPLDGLLDSTLRAEFGPSHLEMSGRFDLFGTGHGGSGTAHFASSDAAPLLQALAAPGLASGTPADLSAAIAIGETGVALSDLAGKIGDTTVGGTLRWQRSGGDEPSVTGALDLDRLSLDGLLGTLLGPDKPAVPGNIWSNEPFDSPGMANLPRSAVKLQVGSLDLGLGLVAQHASFELGTGPALLTLKRGSARLADGTLEGEMVLRRDGGQAALEASLGTHKVKLDLPAIAAATVDAKLDLAGSGQSALALVTSLAGSGEAAADGVGFVGLASTVLPRLFGEVQSDALAVDDESVGRAFDSAPGGSLSLGRRRFALSLAGGVLSLAPQDKPAALGAIDASLGGSFNIRRMLADIRLTETLRNLPRNWTGAAPAITVAQAGPPTHPTRSIDVSAFVNAMAAGAIARESARIESFEFDLRERAFFNARLAADRRREQDRKTEADAKTVAAEAARRAEADRRAKADAFVPPRDGDGRFGRPAGAPPPPAPDSPEAIAPPAADDPAPAH